MLWIAALLTTQLSAISYTVFTVRVEQQKLPSYLQTFQFLHLTWVNFATTGLRV